MIRRAQVSPFMIIGLLLFFFFVIILSNQDAVVQRAQRPQELSSASDVRIYVESCLQKTAQEALLENGRQGGYFLLPEYATTNLTENVPYYKEGGVLLIPTDQTIAGEVGKYVDALLDICLGDFEPFRKQGQEISFQPPQTAALLTRDGTLQLVTTLSVSITKKEKTTTLQEFTVDVDVTQSYENLHLARTIVETMEGSDVCVTCFAEQAQQAKVFVGILPNSNQTTLFELRDDNYTFDNKPYYLRFGVKHE
ncbi:TPA: hypothetical protein HA249_02555 [Candidatus Woesearchaeota archaeon]|nr:hypothetical protein [Candidatus Woesearchaeota archaeon]HII88529.1 hypothetical protein [Candidatus Woesearchaeota archaeon]